MEFIRIKAKEIAQKHCILFYSVVLFPTGVQVNNFNYTMQVY